MKRAEERLAKTIIRSPIDGVIATPQVENMVGHKLKEGDNFVDIVDNSQELVDVAIGEADVALLKPGQKANLKLDGFPERTFHGQVSVVSPQGTRRRRFSRGLRLRIRTARCDQACRAGERFQRDRDPQAW